MIKIIQEEITKTICDICNKECVHGSKTNKAMYLDVSFGYESDKDGCFGEFEFCQKCAGKVWGVLETAFPKLKLNDLYRGKT